MAMKPPPLAKEFPKTANFQGIHAACPHCGNAAMYPQVNTVNLQGHQPYSIGYRFLYMAYCAACNEIVIGRRHDKGNKLVWPPTTLPDNAPHGLDKHIKKAYDEARIIIDLSPQAAAVLARRCVQHSIRTELGITKATLNLEIQEAITRPELSRTTKNAIDQIREIGNWGAHPSKDPADTLIEVTLEQAMYTIEALEMLFNDLYIAPKKFEDMQVTIANKKQGKGS